MMRRAWGEIGGNLDEETVKVLEKIGADPKNINSEGLFG